MKRSLKAFATASFVVTVATLPACESTPPARNPPGPAPTTSVPPVATIEPVASTTPTTAPSTEPTTAPTTAPTVVKKKLGAPQPGDKVEKRPDGSCWAMHVPDMSGFKCEPGWSCNPPAPYSYEVECK